MVDDGLDVGVAAARQRGRSFASAGQKIVSAECSPAVMRMVPASLSRSSLNPARSPLISSKCGPGALSRRSPASGAATLLVGSSQQPQAQSGFETADGVAERRLRNAELCRRPF